MVLAIKEIETNLNPGAPLSEWRHMSESEEELEQYMRAKNGYICTRCDQFVGRDPGLHELRTHSSG